MREYGVNVCSEECGMLVVPPSYDSRYRGVMWTYMGSPVSAQLRYCPFCGTRVGVERRENGSIAWREASVPRAALEWVVNIAGGDFNDCPIAGNGAFEDLPDNWCRACVVRDPDGALYEECKCDRKECRVEECWIEAALKAAEDGSDE